MSDGLRSMLLGTLILDTIALVALILTIVRPAIQEADARDRIITLFLVGVAAQCFHFIEEFSTGLYRLLPESMGLVPWSGEFFVVLNLSWIAVWLLSAVGLRRDLRVAYFPIWFFTIGMTGNLFFHPLLALNAGGYYPGLWTSPIVGVLGILLLAGLLRHTRPRPRPAWG